MSDGVPMSLSYKSLSFTLLHPNKSVIDDEDDDDDDSDDENDKTPTYIQRQMTNIPYM